MSVIVGAEMLKEWATWQKICPLCRHVCPLLLSLEEGGQIMCAWCARDHREEAAYAKRKAIPKRQHERMDTAAS